MRWKVRFYANAPREVPLDFRTPIGDFRGTPIFPNWDGPKGWCFEAYVDEGDNPADAMRSAMPGMLSLINQLEFVSGLGDIIVFNVHQIFRSPEDEDSLTDDEIRNLNTPQFLQRLFVFPPQPPVQSHRQGNVRIDVADIANVHNRNITPEILQEIKENLAEQ